MKNGLHKGKDEGSWPNFLLNTLGLGQSGNPGSYLYSLSPGGGHVSTQIPRIYSYPTVPYSYLPPVPGLFPGATPRPGFVPVGFLLRSGDWLLLGGGSGDRSVRGRWW